jgi:hypothetical protein
MFHRPFSILVVLWILAWDPLWSVAINCCATGQKNIYVRLQKTPAICWVCVLKEPCELWNHNAWSLQLKKIGLGEQKKQNIMYNMMTNVQKFVLMFNGMMSVFLVECCEGDRTT